MIEPDSGSGGATGAPGAGERLRTARTALGLAEEDVADALNLPVRVIVDLEAEAWDDLPAAAFTRGYIRAYAKLLDVDGDDLVADYERFAGTAETVELELPVTPPAAATDVLRRQPDRIVPIAVAAVAVLFVLWLIWPADEPGVTPARIAAVEPAQPETPTAVESDRPAAEVPAVEPEVRATAVDAPEPAPPSSADAVPEPQPSTAPQDVSAAAPVEPEVALELVPVEVQSEVDAPVEPAPALVEPAPAPVEPASAPVESVAAVAEATPVATAVDTTPGRVVSRRLTELGDDRIELTFTAECWVEVKDQDDRNLYGNLSRAGDELELIGAAPFRLLLGYAPGASVRFNGEPVALARYTRNNVAAFWLGRR